MFKKVGIIALACSILVSGAAFAETKEITEVVEQTDYSISFDDEKEWLEDLKVNTADMAKLEILYKEAIALEENGKEDEAEAKWDEIDTILENYYDEEEFDYTFEEEKEWLEEIGVNSADMAKLESLYNEAIALEENGKEDEAEAKWNEIDTILENYYDEEDYDFTFEEEKEWLEEMGVSAADTAKLETLFNEVIALEENGKEDEAEAKWNEIDTILENYYDEEDYDFTFEEETEWLEEMGVNSADMAKLETLFNEVIALEENGKEDEAEAKWNEIDTILENYYDEDDYDFTFEEEKEWLEEMGVSAADTAKLEILYNEVIALEENGKEDEAEAKWNEIDTILENYYDDEEFDSEEYDDESDFTFEDEKEWLEELGVSAADTAKLESLYNEVVALEENGKEDEAEAKWNEIDTIFENYCDEEDYDSEDYDDEDYDDADFDLEEYDEADDTDEEFKNEDD